jgi:hypothetical protein
MMIGYNANPNADMKIKVNCRGENCAWWDGIRGCCIVVSLVSALDGIE